MTSSGSNPLDKSVRDATEVTNEVNEKIRTFRSNNKDVESAAKGLLKRLRKACEHARQLLLHFSLAYLLALDDPTRQSLCIWVTPVHGLVLKVRRKVNKFKINASPKLRGVEYSFDAGPLEAVCTELQAAVLKGVIVCGLIPKAPGKLSDYPISCSCFNQKLTTSSM